MSRERDILDAYWKVVKEDPTNFDSWVNLLQAVEQVDDSKKARETYDSFLKRYPYCYGYWKKYADMEKRHKHPERCLEVYERAVKAIPLSIDIWIAYVDQYKEIVKDSESREKKIRSLYEKSIDAAGLEFRSDRLWESYFNWEIDARRYKQAMAVYDRLIKTPTYLYSANFDRLQKFVNDHSPEEILSDSEYNSHFKDVEAALLEKNVEMYTVEEVQVEIRAEKLRDKDKRRSETKSSKSQTSSKFNRKRKKHRRSSRSDSESSSVSGDDTAEAVGAEPPVKQKKDAVEEGRMDDIGEQNGTVTQCGDAAELIAETTVLAEQQFRTELRKRFSDECLKLFRLKILDKRRKYHLSTEQEVSKRWGFEEQIKRPYFHVKPLERAQLKNWRTYLDFEIGVGNRQRIGVLFERCLIACALYEDIWIKYARYLETADGDSVREVYKRACYTHLPKKPNPHLAWAAYEERLGNVGEALRILKDFERDVPGLVQIQLRRIGLMRRQAARADGAKSADGGSNNNSTAASVSYSDVAHTYESIIRDSTYSPRALAFYAIKYARFVAKVRNDRGLAEKILLDAVERDQSNPQLHLQLVDLAYHSQPFSERDMLKALDRALHQSQMSDTDKLKFSCRKLEFLEDLGSDIKALQDHYEWHLKLSKLVGASGSKKRGADDKSAEKKSASGEVPVSVASAVVPVAAVAPPMSNPYEMYYAAQGAAQAGWAPQQQFGTGGYFYPPTY